MIRDLFILTDIIRSYEKLTEYLLCRSVTVPRNYREFEQLERDMIVNTIEICQGNVNQVAKLLSCKRTTLDVRMKRLGIKVHYIEGSYELLNIEVSEIRESRKRKFVNV